MKVEKDLSSILLKSFYVIKLPHHSKKIDSIWHGNLNWNTNRSKTPLSSRLNSLIFGLSVVGYSAMSCFSAPTYLDKGYLPNSLENANFFSLHHPRGSGGVSAWKTRDNGARNTSILSQSRDLLMKWSLLFQLITGFLPTLGWLSIPKSSCAFFVPHNFRILYFLTAL